MSYKSVIGAVTLAAMVSSSALAADGALAPGKPAGVQNAQISTGGLILGAVGVGLFAAVAIIVADQNSGRNPTPQTFTPATTAP